MQRHVSKQRQTATRTAVYSFMTLTVAVIVGILTLIILGYSFNERDGRLEQGGLLQIASTPNGAAVTLDELKLGSQTDTKATVDVGSHSVSIDRSGYRSWKKTIYINAGEIGWINYARLIPTKLSPQPVRTFAVLSGSLASPQHKYLVMKQAPDQPVFELADLQSDTIKYSTLSLSATSYTAPSAGKTQAFTLESWSQDEAAILVKHTYDDTKTEWLLLNRESPEKSINISASFGVQPTKLIFAGNGNKLLFVQSDNSVRRINLDEQTLSRPLVSNVEDFSEYDDKTIIYTTLADTATAKRTVGYAAVDIAQPQTIHSYPADGQPLRAAMETYFNKRYISTVYGQKLTIESGSLPTPDRAADLKVFKTQTIPAGITRLSVTPNGRFIVSELPDGYATYDVELKKYDKTAWVYPATADRPIQWLDDYIVWSDNGGQLRIYDFDGANQQTIVPVTEGFASTINPNGKYLYGVLKTDKGFELRRVQLILN
ncbi:MAG: PEGA domain-containing protein [Sulfuriferula sp.]